MVYIYCWNKDKIGKGAGQARAIAVCKKAECKWLKCEECTFVSAGEKRLRKSALKKLAAKAEEGGCPNED